MFAYFFFPIVVLVLVVFGVWMYVLQRRRAMRDWASLNDDASDMLAAMRVAREATIDQALASIGAVDRRFSRAVFEDFLYALYAAAHGARGTDRLAWFSPYLGPGADAALRARPATAVRDIVVGGMHLDTVTADRSTRRIAVEVTFTANYTEEHAGSAESFYVEETWRLTRQDGVSFRTPDMATVIACPNCGGALDARVAGK